MITEMLWTCASDVVIAVLFLRALRGDLAACAAVLLFARFLNGMTGASVIPPLFVVVTLSALAACISIRRVRCWRFGWSWETIICIFGACIALLTFIELILGRSTLRGVDYHTFTRETICCSVLPAVLLFSAAFHTSAYSIILSFSKTLTLLGGIIILAGMLGWFFEGSNDLGFRTGRFILFGQNTILSGGLVVLVASGSAVWLFPFASRKWYTFTCLAFSGFAIYLIGSTQSVIAFTILLLSISFKKKSHPLYWLFLTGGTLATVWFAVEFSRSDDAIAPSTDALSRLKHISADFKDDPSTRFSQFLESLERAIENPFLGNGFNSWRNGETFTQVSESRLGVVTTSEATGYPHGVLSSILNDRGLVLGLIFVILYSIVLLHAIHSIWLGLPSNSAWSAAIFLLSLCLAGPLFSGTYWTSGTLIVPLTLSMIARSQIYCGIVTRSKTLPLSRSPPKQIYID